MKRNIPISRKLLKDRFIRWIFRRHVGVQIYLAVGSTHLRSQHFNSCIWEVVKRLERKPAMTAEELIKTFEIYAVEDGAARFPWREISESVFDGATDPYYKKQAQEAKARNEERRQRRQRKFQELLDAINGINPGVPEWTP